VSIFTHPFWRVAHDARFALRWLRSTAASHLAARSNRIGLRSLVTLPLASTQDALSLTTRQLRVMAEQQYHLWVFDLMPAACSSVPPLDGSQQASHRTALGGIVSTAEPLIRLTVHAFRFVGEPFRHDRAPS
jgi:hypothetical protein